jgi:serine protease Do
MEDLSILEAVERYITGQMSPDERVYFESLRKSNPEIDQAVVEHTFFLQQMNRFEETRSFKSLLNDTHINLAEKGLIKSPRLKGRAKVVYLFNRYKRTVAVAATIAGITAMTMSALVWSLSPVKPVNQQDFKNLSRDLDNKIQQVRNESNSKIQQVRNEKFAAGTTTEPETTTPIPYTKGGTGFLIDTKGYVVTNAHVVENARHIAVQTDNGSELRAELVYADARRDIAFLKITDRNFKAPSSLPYSIRKSGGELAEQIFTLGFPRNNIVYGDGYIASRTGYDGDTLACQIAIPAYHGNSGSPILSRNGEIIGIITKKQDIADGAVLAVKSKYIYQTLSDLQSKNGELKNIRLSGSSSLKGKERSQQVKTMADYVYMVKVD